MPDPSPRPLPERSNLQITALSLEAQRELMPQALGLFAVSLPIFVWVGSFATDASFMAASFAVFAINWGAFYVIVNWLRRPEAANVGRRLRIQILGALLWAGAVAQVSAFGDAAGPARESILMMAAGAAVICLFFVSPSLPALLIVGPVAMAGPLIALFSQPQSRNQGTLAWGAFALAYLLSLILNRNLRQQYGLTAERAALTAERESSLARAESLARSKSSLVATLSQEIRNGLTGVIHVLAAAAGQNARSAPSRAQIAAALNAATDLVGVLDATLDSEIAQAGALEIGTIAFDAVLQVRELAIQARAQASERGLEFAVWVDPDLDARATGAAMADPARSRQILANLLANAIRYTPRGRVEMRIEPRGEDRLAIAIADTGPGLSNDELERAFEPFGRVERTAAGVPGAGLGLSLSRELARLMRCELLAESATGVGSCFTLLLPFDPRVSLKQPEVESELSRGGGLKVLLAEEDPLAAAAVRKILEELGHQVAQARDGRRALDLAGACPFDLVILSAGMTGLDAQAATAAIRALEGDAATTPLIVLIDGDLAQSQACLQAGADTVLRKPVTVSALARAVTEAVRAHPAEKRAAA